METTDAVIRFISCYFDPTSVGGHSKQTSEAYEQIALSLGADPKDIVFFTDIPGEARAARAVGCRRVEFHGARSWLFRWDGGGCSRGQCGSRPGGAVGGRSPSGGELLRC